MIQVVVENINIEGAHWIFIVQKSHCEKYNLHCMLKLIAPGCDVVQIDGLTEGAACTVLKARELIDDSTPLLMANCDQFIEWNPSKFLYQALAEGVDGSILTFESTHPKWSFVKLDENGLVTEVAEKKPISNIATVGVYFWRKGSDFCKYADQMMLQEDKRVNSEWYVY